MEVLLFLLQQLQHGTFACHSDELITFYASFLSTKTSSFQTIMNRLNAVRLLHSYHGFPSEALKSFEVSLTNIGLKRISPEKTIKHTHSAQTAPEHSTSFTRNHLVPVYSRFLFAPSDNSFDPSRHLTHQDIKFTTSGAVLRIKCSKTLQHKEGILMIQLPNVPNSILCQLSASQHYFRMVPSSPTAPFFCLPATSACRPIYFMTILLNPQAPRLPYRPRPGGLLTTQLQMQRSDLRLSSPRS